MVFFASLLIAIRQNQAKMPLANEPSSCDPGLQAFLAFPTTYEIPAGGCTYLRTNIVMGCNTSCTVKKWNQTTLVETYQNPLIIVDRLYTFTIHAPEYQPLLLEIVMIDQANVQEMQGYPKQVVNVFVSTLPSANISFNYSTNPSITQPINVYVTNFVDVISYSQNNYVYTGYNDSVPQPSIWPQIPQNFITYMKQLNEDENSYKEFTFTSYGTSLYSFYSDTTQQFSLQYSPAPQTQAETYTGLLPNFQILIKGDSQQGVYLQNDPQISYSNTNQPTQPPSGGGGLGPGAIVGIVIAVIVIIAIIVVAVLCVVKRNNSSTNDFHP